jgi:hypothetical protein
VALGRPGDAAREAEAVLVETGEKDPGALERAADVLLAAGKAPRSVELYTRALALGAKRRADVRAKRGGAALEAGNERLAREDLEAVVPEPGALPDSREANARLAPLAPVLYRRGLAPGSKAARDRDLDGAWKIADPPPELRHELAVLWLDADGFQEQFAELTVNPVATPERIRSMTACAARSRRALVLDPDADFDKNWSGVLTGIVFLQSVGDPDSVRTLAKNLVPIWPEQLVFVYLAIRARRLAAPGDPEALALVYQALDAIPDRKHPTIAAITQTFVHLAWECWVSSGFPKTLDLARVERGARLADCVDAWCELSQEKLQSGDIAGAKEALGRAEKATGHQPRTEPEVMIEVYRAMIMGTEGHGAEALERARRLDAKFHTPSSLEHLLDQLAAAGANEEILAVAKDREATAFPHSRDVIARAAEILRKAKGN